MAAACLLADRAPRSGAFVSRFSLAGRRGSRTAGRALVIAAAVSTAAPLAATTTASAASGSHRLHAYSTHRPMAKPAALKALAASGRLHALAHQQAAQHGEGFDRSQFPARGPVSAMVELSARPAVRAFVAARVH